MRSGALARRLDRIAAVLLGGSLLLLAVPSGAPAADTGRVHRLGFLSGASAVTGASTREAVLDGLQELGYREGQSLVLETRYADGRFDRLPVLARDLVARGVELILTQTTPATVAARAATSTIPIVSVTSGDLVGAGVVASLARPGGNVTGLSFLGTELAVKQLELLREIAPATIRVGFLAARAYPPEVLFFQEMERVAPALGVSVRFVDTGTTPDYPALFAAVAREQVGGLVVAPSNLNAPTWGQIPELAARARLPAIYSSREFVEADGLASYGIDRPRFFRRAALYVDRILKGARPADLPIEQPTQFELVLNLRAARTLGLTPSPSLLLRTDQAIR